MKKLMSAALLLMSVGAFAQSARKPETLKVDDFAFMTGRWRGQLKDGNIAEQICSTVRLGQMMCEFRLSTPKQWIMFEFYSLRDTDKGVELVGRVFDTALTMGGENDERLLLKPIEFSDEKVVFGGEPGGAVKTSALIRNGKDAMHGHIEHSGGTVDVNWERVAYDAPMN